MQRDNEIWPIHKKKNYQKMSLRKPSIILLDKDFKSIVINMFKQLKETTKTKRHQENNASTENSNKKINNYEQKQNHNAEAEKYSK